MSKLNEDKVVKTINIYETTNYDKFSKVIGNRKVNKGHAASLQKEMLEHGNYLIDEPVEVNKDFKIFDGQHSFEAAKDLGLPVYYQVVENVSVPKMRLRNSNRKNWDWLDFAVSYRDEEHNENYQLFLQLIEDYQEKFSVILFYCGVQSRTSKQTKDFLNGNFIMKDYERVQKMLGQYQELADTARVHNREFSFACFRFMNNTTYNHAKMLAKLRIHKGVLKNIYLENEYYFSLQDIWRA